jgi:hypothetical protein
MLELPDGVSVKEIILASPRGERITADFTLIPEEFIVHQNYPNPFNPVTTIRYDLPEQSTVKLVIYDITGRAVRTLVDEAQEPGYKTVIWNSRNNEGISVGAGLYIYRIEAGKYQRSRKMILLK